MFQIPKIPQSTQDLVKAVESGTSLLRNIFSEEGAHYTAISATAATMAAGLSISAGGTYAHDWTAALLAQFEACLAAMTSTWATQEANSATTFASLAINATQIRYSTIINQAMSAAVDVADQCQSFTGDSLATISEELFSTAKTADDALARFCVEAYKWQGITPDTPEEVAGLNLCASLANDVIAYAEAYGLAVAESYDLQTLTQQTLNERAVAFAKAAGLASMANDPCAQALFQVAGSPELQKALGIKDKATKLVDSNDWNTYKNLFGT